MQHIVSQTKLKLTSYSTLDNSLHTQAQRPGNISPVPRPCRALDCALSSPHPRTPTTSLASATHGILFIKLQKLWNITNLCVSFDNLVLMTG